MVYTYTPTYYSTFHDSISSLCKTILPFSFKKKRLPAIAAAEQKLSKLQSDNLKWQQESFHQILKLMGFCREGIVPETEVSAFKSHLIETLMASSVDYEQPIILKDKLIFLQELMYAKCITEEEYHSSKRPLLQRLEAEGIEIDPRDVVPRRAARKESSSEEWTEIDLNDERLTKESSNSKNKSKQIKKGAASSVLGFISSSNRNGKSKEEEKGVFHHHHRYDENMRPNELRISTENPFWNSSHLRGEDSETKSILMPESSSLASENNNTGERAKRKPFRPLFQGDSRDHRSGEEKSSTSGKKKQWGFEGFKKWKRSNPEEDETAPLSLGERSDDREKGFSGITGKLVENPIGEGPDTKQIKRKLHPSGAASDFFVDKVLAEKIKKELSRIQAELGANNANVHFSDEQIEAISTRLPVDKADLKRFFPKSWCDRYGDVVLDVVRREFKEHVSEMGNKSKRWAIFDDDDDDAAAANNNINEGEHPRTDNNNKGFKYNPFFDVY